MLRIADDVGVDEGVVTKAVKEPGGTDRSTFDGGTGCWCDTATGTAACCEIRGVLAAAEVLCLLHGDAAERAGHAFGTSSAGRADVDGPATGSGRGDQRHAQHKNSARLHTHSAYNMSRVSDSVT